jgi:hypothetical protein
MVKTLRITTIAAAALAVVFFIFPVVYGVRSDPAIEQFLKSPGIIELFNKASDARASRSSSQESPLVRQAQMLAGYLNPPAPSAKTTAAPTTAAAPAPKAPVSAKFRLLGTSVHESDPQMSFAFIDEPGKGLHWIRQSAEVMHLVIEEVKDGIVVVRDGQRTFEVAAEPRPTTSSLLDGAPGAQPTVVAPATGARAVTPGPSVRPSSPVTTTMQQGPDISEEESAALEALVERLKSLQKSGKSNKTTAAGSADSSSDDPAAAIEKLMSDFGSSKVGDDEAKRLGDLGKELDGSQHEPNTPAGDKTGDGARSKSPIPPKRRPAN